MLDHLNLDTYCCIIHFKNSLKLYRHFLKLFGETRLVKSVKHLPLSIKSIYPIQKYPHITESYAWIPKMFGYIFLLPIKHLMSFGICSTPKLSK